MKRSGVGAFILYMSAQAAASFTPEAAANEPRAAVPVAPKEQKIQRLVLADPTWDAFVFVSAAAAIALEISALEAPSSTDQTSWAFQAPEPQFDFLGALADVGMIQAPQDASQIEHHWLS